MQKILKENVFTGDEKLFLQFELGKKKYGNEKIFLEDPISANDLQQSENNSIKMEYVIKDDLNEEIVKGDSTARIGTTLVNLMNTIEKIRPILMKYYDLIQDFDVNKIQKLYFNIETIINEFKLRELKVDYKIDEALIKIHQTIATKDDEELKSCKQLIQTLSTEKDADKDFLHILNFIEKLFYLKNNNYNYYSYADLIWITAEIIAQDKDILYQDYSFLLLNIIKKLEYKLEEKVNQALKELIHQIFKNFYNDYYCVREPEKLFEFLTDVKKNMVNNPYNKYYKNIYEYISNIQKEAISRKTNKEYDKVKRFEKFSLKEMSKIFVETIIDDIEYISSNYNDVPDVLSKANMISENTCKYEISSFYELFYISKYYILKDGNNLKECMLCGRYFVTQNKDSEKHCRRIYKEGLTCSGYINCNNKKSNSYEARISREKNSIRAMLRKRVSKNNNSELTEFDKKLQEKEIEIALEKITQEKEKKVESKEITREEKEEALKKFTQEENKKLLEWLRKEHEELKKYK